MISRYALLHALQLKLSFVRGRVACWLVRLTPHPASSFGQGVSLCFEDDLQIDDVQILSSTPVSTSQAKREMGTEQEDENHGNTEQNCEYSNNIELPVFKMGKKNHYTIREATSVLLCYEEQ
ncbi:uncharacterized protein [Pocillopora verrucosa]|uniref:uncharacterized protein isoform X2 n=1 Tax=Pocillopora verrucosa TaxID=203993 RepID=UPI003342543E